VATEFRNESFYLIGGQTPGRLAMNDSCGGGLLGFHGSEANKTHHRCNQDCACHVCKCVKLTPFKRFSYSPFLSLENEFFSSLKSSLETGQNYQN
jgi:hypothetical protein